jgi:hypothetical protein
MTTTDANLLVGSGVPPLVAKLIGNSVQIGLVAAGNNIATSLPLRAKMNVVATTAASTGVQLPLLELGATVIVRNAGANTLAVYPASTSDKINGATAGAAFNLATGRSAYFQRIAGDDTFAGLFAAS